jgi:VanZ family protein
MGAIFYASSLHQPPLAEAVSDKLGHFLAYVILGVLVTRGVAGRLPTRLSWRTALLSLCVTIAYGISDEIHQIYVPGRTADIYDVAADAAGGLIATGASALWGILPARADVRGAAS